MARSTDKRNRNLYSTTIYRWPWPNCYWKKFSVTMQQFLKCTYSSRKEVKSVFGLLINGWYYSSHYTKMCYTTLQGNHRCTAHLIENSKTFLWPHLDLFVLSVTVIFHLFTLTLASAMTDTMVHGLVWYIGSTLCVQTLVILSLIHCCACFRHWVLKKG